MTATETFVILERVKKMMAQAVEKETAALK